MKSFLSNVKFVLTMALVATLVGSCGDFKKTSVVTPPSTGSLDFSRFVSIGNSLTAGYQSGALYASAQKWSFPADIARQAGLPDSSFEQPLFTDPGVGGRLEIVSLSGTSPTITAASANSTLQPTDVGLLRPFNNLGVPGAIAYDLIDTSDFATKAFLRQNPFFYSILRSSAFGKSVVAQALALKPTFVSVWIGANDVLGYATSGGTTGSDPATHTLPTDVATFTGVYDQIMNALLTGAPNAKFVVANIPDVAAIPFFTTLPPFVLGPNGSPIVVSGHHVPLYVQRHDASGKLYVGLADTLHDYILLTAIDEISSLYGTKANLPISDSLVLDAYEAGNVEVAIAGYNSAIAQVAASNPTRIALVDAYTIFNNFAKYGYVGQGISLDNSFITGGFFGLDGVHPTSQGYAYVANIFIDAINSKFGSNIPIVPIASAPSSIIFAPQAGATRMGLPRISRSDLQYTLKLIQGGSMR